MDNMLGKLCAGLALSLLAASCATEAVPVESSLSDQASRSWTPMPDGPLSPRHRATAVAVGTKVLIVGGRDTTPCPPTAGCSRSTEPALQDGAIFDVATGDWTKTTPAPVPIEWVSTTTIGDTVFFWVLNRSEGGEDGPTFFSYEITTERWATLPTPATDPDPLRSLVSADGAVIAYQRTQERTAAADFSYDIASSSWRELPPDPLSPSFDRAITWTGETLILTGIPVFRAADSGGPFFYRAATLANDNIWHEHPTSEIIGWSPSWFWAEDQLINPSLGTADGGSTSDWERPYPHGGTFHPETGTWASLPDPPEPVAGTPPMANGRLVTGSGWLLDMSSDTWTQLGLPDDAAQEASSSAFPDGAIIVWGGASWPSEGGHRLHNQGWYFPTGR